MLIIVKRDKVNKIFGYICSQIEIAVTCKVTAVFLPKIPYYRSASSS